MILVDWFIFITQSKEPSPLLVWNDAQHSTKYTHKEKCNIFRNMQSSLVSFWIQLKWRKMSSTSSEKKGENGFSLVCLKYSLCLYNFIFLVNKSTSFTKSEHFKNIKMSLSLALWMCGVWTGTMDSTRQMGNGNNYS